MDYTFNISIYLKLFLNKMKRKYIGDNSIYLIELLGEVHELTTCEVIKTEVGT